MWETDRWETDKGHCCDAINTFPSQPDNQSQSTSDELSPQINTKTWPVAALTSYVNKPWPSTPDRLKQTSDWLVDSGVFTPDYVTETAALWNTQQTVCITSDRSVIITSDFSCLTWWGHLTHTWWGTGSFILTVWCKLFHGWNVK